MTRWVAAVLVAGGLAGCACGSAAAPDASADAAESLRRFVGLSVRYRSACALRADGEAVCWGELWDSRRVLAGRLDVIVCGPDTACGLDRAGSVVCFESDWDAGGPIAQEPVPPPSGPFAALAHAGHHACAIDPDGTVGCWSWWRYAPDVYPPDGFVPTYPPPTAEPLANVSLDAWACAVTRGGEGVCWHPFLPDDGTPAGAPRGIAPPSGSFQWIQRNGAGSCGLRTDGEVECWSNSDTWLTEMGAPPPGPFVLLTAGGGPMCALTAAGEAVCWGTGWLPNTETGWEGVARYQPMGERYTAIGAGRTFVCGILLDGTLSCWGHDEWGVTSPPTVE